MNPDGRLFIFSPIIYPGFSDRRYMDVQGFFDRFVKAREGFPLWDYLPPDLARRVRAGEELNLDLAGFRAVVASINRMLADPAFHQKLRDYWHARVVYFDTGGLMEQLEARDLQLYRSLHCNFAQDPGLAGTDAGAYAAHSLNHLLLTMLFFRDGRGAGYAFERGLFDSVRTLKKKLALAGWDFVATHEISPFYLTVEFRPSPGVAP
jgi:hypothetical protein